MWGAHEHKSIKFKLYETLRDRAKVQQEGHETW